jgi:intergrase/recombinase
LLRIAALSIYRIETILLCDGRDLNPRTPTRLDPESVLLPSYNSVYNEFESWLKNQNFSDDYRISVINYIKKFIVEDTPIEELREIINKTVPYFGISVRVYLNFLMSQQYLTEEQGAVFKKTIKRKKANSDIFVPETEDVIKAFNNLQDERDKTLFKLLAFSGIRLTELMKTLSEFDRDKLVLNEKIAKYSLGWRRGKKNSNYVYLPKQFALTLNKIPITKKTILSVGWKSGLNCDPDLTTEYSVFLT